MKLVAAALLGTAFLIGCSGGGSVQPQPQPSPVPTRAPCTALIVNDPQLALIAPAAGATGVPTTVGSITFSASRLENGLSLFPADGGAQVDGGPITASNGNYVSALPVLRSHVTYQVAIYPLTTSCAYFPGSFTTG
jgi:hypothetical protein